MSASSRQMHTQCITPCTVMVTVAVEVRPLASLMPYVNVSVPINPLLGVYLNDPFSLTTAVPDFGSSLMNHTLPPAALGMSLLAKLPETAVFLTVLKASSRAMGPLLPLGTVQRQQLPMPTMEGENGTILLKRNEGQRKGKHYSH